MNFLESVKQITKNSRDIYEAAQNKINNKTKPLGSLGKLEETALKMCMIQNTLNPKIKHKELFVFAADHGIAKAGVSAFPQEVTPQMVYNFLAEGAAINVLSKHNNADIKIIDIGVNHDFPKNTKLIDRKTNYGTKNFLEDAAMTKEEAQKALNAGFDLFIESNKSKTIDALLLGEMGIGNTTSSSAIISCITGKSPVKTTGCGTGIDKNKLHNKIKIIKKALRFHKPDKKDPLDILQKIGGFEIAGITGAVLGAAFSKKAVIIDGLISTAAALLAYLFNPYSADYIFASHRSVEKGQSFALNIMGLSPLLDLGMRLGEGTGAALAVNIVEASCKIMSEMASFEDAGVSR